MSGAKTIDLARLALDDRRLRLASSLVLLPATSLMTQRLARFEHVLADAANGRRLIREAHAALDARTG